MLTELKFVMGSVAKKDYLPALTHLVIENGTVRGFNGTLALCSPIPFDIVCKPKAAPMIQAIKNCNNTVSLSLTNAGRLSIKSGKFKAFVECTEQPTNHVVPEGDRIEINGAELLLAVKTLNDFMGDDASRPWSNGILLRGKSAYATNNVVIAEYWTGVDFPTVNIPRAAVRELLRINEAPEYAQATGTSFSLHYSGGRWIRTQVGASDWPDIKRILDVPSNPLGVEEDLFLGLEAIKPFCDNLGKVHFVDGQVRTHLQESEGSFYDLDNFPFEGCYNVDMLMSLRSVAQKIDFTTYPKPALFFGDRVRGAIVGMKK